MDVWTFMFIFMFSYYLQVYFLYFWGKNKKATTLDSLGRGVPVGRTDAHTTAKRTAVSIFLPQTDKKRTNRTSIWGRALELALRVASVLVCVNDTGAPNRSTHFDPHDRIYLNSYICTINPSFLDCANEA